MMKTTTCGFVAKLGGCLLLTSCVMMSMNGWGQTYKGTSSNYSGLLKKLKSGDTLILEAGTYTSGLSIHKLKGSKDAPIIISGPAKGTPALFLARNGRDTVEVFGSSFVVIKNLELDGKGLAVHGVNARSTGGQVHDITIENLIIKNHGKTQQIVGISTNQTPTWNWVIRNNVIIGAGTGLYLGNSDGKNPFVNGIIEYNLVMNTVGYNMQIKHQVDRPNLPGMPTEGRTIIRHNVFSKAKKGTGKSDGARPNLLVGHFPNSGDGAKDVYMIYGNFFYQNTSGQPLFQGEGNIALYGNLFVNTLGNAVQVGRHNGRPKMIRVFNNTVVAKGSGIRVGGGDSAFKQIVMGNAVFASGAISGPVKSDNFEGSYSGAGKYLWNPLVAPGELDLFPRAGKLAGKEMSKSEVGRFTDWDRDFNGSKRKAGFKGAYVGGPRNIGWLPKLERKPLKSALDIMAGPGPYKKLSALAKQIKSGQGLGRVLQALRSKLKSTDPQELKEAKMMFEALHGEGQRVYQAAKALVKTDVLAALRRMDQIAKQFNGDVLGTNVANDARTLRRDPKVRKEQQGEETWKKVELMVSRMVPHNGSKDHKSAGFRNKNVAAIRIMLGGCRMIVQRYPGTAAAKRAGNMLKSYKSPGV